MKSQWVYVMASPSIPGIVKIGFTMTTIKQRQRELNCDTGSPGDWAPLVFWEVRDCRAVEQYLHRHFHDERIHPKKEYFRVEAEDVAVAFEASPWGVAGGLKIVEKARAEQARREEQARADEERRREVARRRVEWRAQFGEMETRRLAARAESAQAMQDQKDSRKARQAQEAERLKRARQDPRSREARRVEKERVEQAERARKARVVEYTRIFEQAQMAEDARTGERIPMPEQTPVAPMPKAERKRAEMAERWKTTDGGVPFLPGGQHSRTIFIWACDDGTWRVGEIRKLGKVTRRGRVSLLSTHETFEDAVAVAESRHHLTPAEVRPATVAEISRILD